MSSESLRKGAALLASLWLFACGAASGDSESGEETPSGAPSSTGGSSATGTSAGVGDDAAVTATGYVPPDEPGVEVPSADIALEAWCTAFEGGATDCNVDPGSDACGYWTCFACGAVRTHLGACEQQGDVGCVTSTDLARRMGCYLAAFPCLDAITCSFGEAFAQGQACLVGASECASPEAHGL